MKLMTVYDMAERLYTAYANSAKWTTYDGKQIPTWSTLPITTKTHWIQVATEVVKMVGE